MTPNRNRRKQQIDFGELVDQAVAALPKTLRKALRNLEIIIQDNPDDWMLQDMDKRAEELLGLYVGVPLPERSHDMAPYLPDQIYIFRRALVRMYPKAAELREQIRITLLHELAHYFGFDDDYLRANGWY